MKKDELMIRFANVSYVMSMLVGFLFVKVTLGMSLILPPIGYILKYTFTGNANPLSLKSK